MAHVTIKCPETGKFCRPPIKAASLAQADKIGIFNNTIICEHCGKPHLFDRETVVVVPDVEP